MTWDVTKVYDFVVDSKELAVRFALIISRKLDLGQPTDGYLDMWYCLCNITFSLEEEYSKYLVAATWDFTDLEFDQLRAMYITVLTKHNRYKGIS
jgi:hypothetical protein